MPVKKKCARPRPSEAQPGQPVSLWFHAHSAPTPATAWSTTLACMFAGGGRIGSGAGLMVGRREPPLPRPCVPKETERMRRGVCRVPLNAQHQGPPALLHTPNVFCRVSIMLYAVGKWYSCLSFVRGKAQPFFLLVRAQPLATHAPTPLTDLSLRPAHRPPSPATHRPTKRHGAPPDPRDGCGHPSPASCRVWLSPDHLGREG